MQLSLLFQQLGIALGLGLLVGLQRESAASPLAGVRTFPLVTVLGTICGLLAQSFGGWAFAAGMLALAIIIFIGKSNEVSKEHYDPGITTEVALLLMFAVGAYLVVGHRAVAIAIGGGAAVLLHFKGELHGIVGRSGAGDLKAVMQFALISLVILPVLPDRTYGLSFAKTTYVIDFVDFFAGEQETQCHEEFSAFTDGFLHLNLQRTMRAGA